MHFSPATEAAINVALLIHRILAAHYGLLCISLLSLDGFFVRSHSGNLLPTHFEDVCEILCNVY